MAIHRLGDKAALKVSRAGKEKDIKVVLQNRNGDKKILKKEHIKTLSLLGADF